VQNKPGKNELLKSAAEDRNNKIGKNTKTAPVQDKKRRRRRNKNIGTG
jgi:hypothetical protein